MRLTTLFLIAAFAASTVDAASYQKIDGRIVDPIQSVAGGNSPIQETIWNPTRT